MNKRTKSNTPLKVIVGIASTFLTGSAIAQQLSRPASERTWHGTIARVPYDFRPPTPTKLRNTFWNENTARVIVPQAFGVGWTINFYPLVHPQPVESLPDPEA